MRSLKVGLLLAAVTVACTGNVEGTDPTGTTAGALEVQTSDTKVFGTFTLGDDKVAFEAVARPNEVYEIDLHLRGLTLDATIDAQNHTSSLDGFASDNGGDTQVQEADRKLLVALTQALDAKLGAQTTGTARMLQRASSMWSEVSPTLKLDRRVMGDEGRGWTMICGSIGQVYGASHDCWSYGWWNAKSSQNAYVGYDTGSTYYWRGYWSTSSYDHASWPYEYGNCFGRCGGGCGSSTQYTSDCHNHDGCVRNGHSIASLWCDDEFTSASDDALFAGDCGHH